MRALLTATTVAAGVALAAGSAQAVDLTIVSWGGAYTASQQKAYHDPYVAANPDVTIINDDNASEGLAKVRGAGRGPATSPGTSSTWLPPTRSPRATRG